MILIGHRGFRDGWPENTIQAFKRAAALGLDMVELDVQLNADGIAFVQHDLRVDRTTGEHGMIHELSTAEMRALRTVRGGQLIPTLREVVEELAVPGRINLMIELKGPGTAEAVCALVEECGIHDRVVISGRVVKYLAEVHALLPRIPLCLNITTCTTLHVDAFMARPTVADLPVPLAFVSLTANWVSEAFVEHVHSLGARALAWNFSRLLAGADLLDRMIELGVDGLMLDNEEALEYARERLLRHARPMCPNCGAAGEDAGYVGNLGLREPVYLCPNCRHLFIEGLEQQSNGGTH